MTYYKKFSMFTLSAMLGISLIGTPVFSQTVSGSTQNKNYTDSSNGGHAVYLSKGSSTLSNPTITKTGDSTEEDADFYGDNAAVLVEKEGKLTINGGKISTNGKHANAVFAYGTGTVNISETQIETKGDNSGGLMTTGGATMNASNLDIDTSGNSSAAIRSDRGGGDVNVSGGSYKTTGTGSPVIYSTADIDVDNATLESTASEAVVIEGGNSVSLKNCQVIGDNTKLNGQAKNYDTIFIYQSMSGDASEGNSEFSAEGGTITSKNEDTFYITNTTTTINLTDTKINNAKDGDFLVAEAAAWGNSGSNGGKAVFNASKEDFSGNIKTDNISAVQLNLKDASHYTGAMNPDGAKGTISVSISDDSTWTLTGDSYIASLDCDKDAIDLNEHKLYVDGKLYENGTASKATITEKDITKTSVSGNQKNNQEKQSFPENKENMFLGKVNKISKNKLTLAIRNGEKEETKTYDITDAIITKGSFGGPDMDRKPPMPKDNQRKDLDMPQKPDGKEIDSSSNNKEERPEKPDQKQEQKEESEKQNPPELPPSISSPKENKTQQNSKEEKATIKDIKVDSMVELKLDENKKVVSVKIGSEKKEKESTERKPRKNSFQKMINQIKEKTKSTLQKMYY